MRKYDLMSSLFWLLCSVLIMIGSFRLPIGTVRNPGPGFMPLIIGFLLSIISTFLYAQSQKQRPSEKKAFWMEKNSWHKVAITGIALLIYAVALPHLGFLFVTVLLMGFLFKSAGEMQWKASLGIAILTTLVFYLLFKVWLKVQLPSGPWGI